MALYVYNEEQEVPSSNAVILNDSIPCNRGFVLHQNGTGILTARGIVNNPCAQFTRYRISYKSNIAVPTGGTLGEISLSIAVDGFPIPYTLSAVTPTAVDSFNEVSGFGYIDVLRCDNPRITLTNTSATGEAITARNTVVSIDRVA